MMATTHITTAVTSASWVAVPLAALGVPLAVCLLSIPVGVYAVLYPDWDHHGSRITWSLPPLSNAVSWTLRGWPINRPVFFLQYGHIIPIPRLQWDLWCRVLPWYCPHRGPLHTEEAAVVFGLVLGLPLWLLPAPIGPHWWVFALQITVGCLAHLYGDMRTVGGLRARGGAPTDRRTIGRVFKTGSTEETRLREHVYRPVAIVSAAVSTVAIVYLSTT
jgi:hypothetical protein